MPRRRFVASLLLTMAIQFVSSYRRGSPHLARYAVTGCLYDVLRHFQSLPRILRLRMLTNASFRRAVVGRVVSARHIRGWTSRCFLLCTGRGGVLHGRKSGAHDRTGTMPGHAQAVATAGGVVVQILRGSWPPFQAIDPPSKSPSNNDRLTAICAAHATPPISSAYCWLPLA